MPDTIAQYRVDVENQITNQTDDEAITPEIDGALRDRLALLVDARLLSGGDTRSAALITGTKDNYAYGIITNNLRRMTVTAAGRVLVKTETESTFDHDVNGTIRAATSVTSPIMYVGANSSMIKRNHDAGGGTLSGLHLGAVEGGGGGWNVFIYPANSGYYHAFSGGGLYVSDSAKTAALSTFQNAKAALQVSSTSRGALICRMTGAEAELIAPGATGDMMLVSITNGNGATITSRGLWYWDNILTTWVKAG